MASRVGPITIQAMAYRAVNKDYNVALHVQRPYQWYMVLHGRIKVQLDDRKFHLGPGQAVLVPPGSKRGYQAATPSPAYLFAMFTNHQLSLDNLKSRVVTVPQTLKAYVDDLIAEGREPGVDSELLATILVSRILIGLHRMEKAGAPTRGKGKKKERFHGPVSGLTVRIEAFMARNLHRPLTRADLAAAVHISEPHLARLFRAATGKSLIDRLTELRLEQSASLLRESNLPITRIALEVGFNSYSHFTKTFKQRLGTSPSAYRRAGGESYRRLFRKSD